jgi:hypothetical protein
VPAPIRALLVFVLIATPGSAQVATGCCQVHVNTRSPDGRSLAGVHLDVTGPGRSLGDRTGADGTASFTLPRPGAYRVAASKDGYIGLSREVQVELGDDVAIDFTLQPQLIDSQSVTVTAPAEPVQATTADAASSADVKAVPDRPATLRDALPLLPGVVRTPEGKLVISDTAEHRNSLIVDQLDATDPATGSFGATVPIDSVVAFNVYKSPFLAEFGRFTSGVVAVETRGGGDNWHWELNDPTPELRILGGHLRGIRAYTPRLNFNGPLIRNRVYFAESFEYVYKHTPVRTLPYPYNEDKREGWNSLTRFDYVPSASQLLTVKVHLAPQKLTYVGLGFYNPQPVTPNYWGHEGMADISHRITIAGGFLESAFSAGEVSARVAGQGDANLVMTPTLNLGNYFLTQDRRSRKFEWLENWTARPLGRERKHHLKTGLSIVGAHAKGSYDARPISIESASGHLLERIEFASQQGYRDHDHETGFYTQDHWVLSPVVSLDLGVRFERQSITGMNKLAPRAGLAWSLRSSTTIRAGAGWFYDRVPLNVFGFGSYPQRTIVSYSLEGEIIDGPSAYANVLGTASSDRGLLVFGSRQPGNFAPRSFVWKVQVDQELNHAVQLRAAFWQGRARDLVVLDPLSFERLNTLLLNSGGRSDFSNFELVSRISLRQDRRVFVSYVHSVTKTNLNEFPDYLGNFPAPLIRPDVFTTASTNIPHRLLAWGVLPITKPLKKGPARLFPPSLSLLQITRGWTAAPVVEYRTGFPYSLLNERQNYAGPPNSWRFPNFFSVDFRVAKNIAVREDHAVQISFSVFNLTNHWNPEAVRWNTADAQVGEFLGQRPRRFRVDFDLLF